MAHRPKPPYTKKDAKAAAEGKPAGLKRRKERRKWVNEHEKSKKQRDVERATNDDRSTTNIQQYILNQNLDKISRYFLSNKRLFSYETFRQVNGDGMQTINKLRGIDNLNVFYKIKQSTLSLMQPKIRLYKVYHSEFKYKPDGSVDETVKPAPLKAPCYKEIKFSDNFGQETAATVSDYLSYETTKPTFRNVGLKSFSWTWNGENFGVIENNIECTLQLVFKSLKDIKASIPGSPNVRYVDLFLWPGSKFVKDTEIVKPKHYEVKALVGYTAPTPAQLNNLNLSQEDIKNIANVEKMNVALSLIMHNYKIDIKEDGQVLVTCSYRGRIETVIGTNQVNIFQDTFQINRPDKSETSYAVNSKASMTHMYSLLDKIRAMWTELNSAGCKNDNCKSRKEIIELLKNDRFFRKAWLTAGGPHVVEKAGGKIEIKKTNYPKIYSWFVNSTKEEHNADRVAAFLRQKIGLYKKQIYQSFGEQLIDGNNTDPGTSPGTRLFCFNASRNTVKNAIGIDKNFDTIPPAKEKEGSDPTVQFGADKVGRCNDISPVTAELKAAVAAGFNSFGTTTEDSKSNRRGPKKKDKAKKGTFNFDGENYPFKFVFLGDLVELACKNGGFSKLKLGDPEDLSVYRPDSYVDEKKVGEDYLLSHARVLVGPIEYLDSKGQIKTINLAQFPISFDYFRAWFFQKVIRRKAVQMPLGSFLGLLISDLVLPAMGLGQKKSIKAGRTKSNVVALSLPGKQISGPVKTTCGEQISDMQELLPLKRVINIESAEFRQNYFEKASKPLSSESLLRTSFDYVLLFVSTIKDMRKRKGDPAVDIKDGIYHFNIGSDMGLMKRMSFKKANLSFLAELRSEQAEEKGEDQLSQLKFPHDTDVTLIGTSLFCPGMFFYVNPGLSGIGSPEDANSLASDLNIGGYHLITEIRSSITQGKFETILVGTQTI
tara:strand:- start:3355 stop:6168 length:2814 start_codon:yes stop_codon:yes gene_type:complete